LPDDGPRDARASAPRLSRSSEIQRVLAGGKRFHGHRLTACVATGTEGPRATWVAGRRVGGAVVRNRAKRLLREGWTRIWPGVRGGWDVVLVARPEIRGASSDEVTEEVRMVLGRAGVLG